MPWYVILLLISIVVGPFDALYLYNKAWKRRQRLRQDQQPDEKQAENQ